MRRVWLLLIALHTFVAPLAAADLAQVPRVIGKEPKYQSGAPKYAMLVFGEAAKFRVWLVLDGDHLYVDRNGNGDLTDAGELVNAVPADDGTAFLNFEGGAIEEGPKLKHTNLRVVRFGKESANANLTIRIADRGEQVVGNDTVGSLEFADKPAAAPIIHLNGPLAMQLNLSGPLSRSAKPVRVNVTIGTPGLGAGTFAALSNEDVPEDQHPVGEFTFGGGRDTPVVVRVVFDQRC